MLKNEGAVERQDIEVFLVLAEELHFSRTAERLHVSAATISQTIAKLARRFGAPLFRQTTPDTRGRRCGPRGRVSRAGFRIWRGPAGGWFAGPAGPRQR